MTPADPTNSTRAPVVLTKKGERYVAHAVVENPATTRRRFFAITGAVAAVGAVRSGPAVAAPESEATAFIRQIAFLHPGGEAAACHAVAAGMRPGELYCVMLLPERGQDDLPALLFTHKGENFTFRPSGRCG